MEESKKLDDARVHALPHSDSDLQMTQALTPQTADSSFSPTQPSNLGDPELTSNTLTPATRFPVDQISLDEMRKQANQKRKQEALAHPMFQPERQPGFCYDNSNAAKFANEWTLRKQHMLIVCLSLHGTSRCDKIAKYMIFKGYEQRHLHLKTYTLIRFHSIKPLVGLFFDIYMVRDYFLDDQQAQSDGFVLDKHNHYYHPTMTEKELQLFFRQFELTESRREMFESLRAQLNIPVWARFDESRFTTIEIIKALLELENRLMEKLQLATGGTQSKETQKDRVEEQSHDQK